MVQVGDSAVCCKAPVLMDSMENTKPFSSNKTIHQNSLFTKACDLYRYNDDVPYSDEEG